MYMYHMYTACTRVHVHVEKQTTNCACEVNVPALGVSQCHDVDAKEFGDLGQRGLVRPNNSGQKGTRVQRRAQRMLRSVDALISIIIESFDGRRRLIRRSLRTLRRLAVHGALSSVRRAAADPLLTCYHDPQRRHHTRERISPSDPVPRACRWCISGKDELVA